MKRLLILLYLFTHSFYTFSEDRQVFTPGQPWLDSNGNQINAHGGGILFHEGVYYWYGEHRPDKGFKTEVGVMCYSSADLYNWKEEGVVLPVSLDKKSPITKGCIIERPKVIYNKKTKQFVMYFHLELKDKGYEAALVGIANSSTPTGKFSLLKTSRVNAGKWPLNMTDKQKKETVNPQHFTEWWTPEWTKAVENGLFTRRDFKGGQMSRDMTLFVDDDQKAYHIYSSEENLTLQIAELTDDYLDYTGKYIRIEPGGHNEAPAIFKKDGKYYMITSGCTGWAPNAARLLVADHILGSWERKPNPCIGRGANLTFRSQGTFILPVPGKKDAYIFMADRWYPQSLSNSRYIWLPILFKDGNPVLKWMDKWSLDVLTGSSEGKEKGKWKLVWSDEFNYEGQPDTAVWSFEKGFVRNHELQWYQEENAYCRNGVLTITAQKEKKVNPYYQSTSKDWRKEREFIEYTSSSIKTSNTKEFQYGRFEIRAKIPTAQGAWPAIWTLGRSGEWPSNGEIDIMEYYRIEGVPHILANVAWGTEQRYHANWSSSAIPFTHFTEKDPQWADKFHIWRMDWDEEAIRLYLDDQLLNETLLSKTNNGSLGNFSNPFKQAHYLLLNLAIGGQHGGIPDNGAFPLKYEIDYVRVYQKEK